MHRPPETVYRFGPFEFRDRSRELLRHGVRVKLQDQPVELLLVLLEHSGSLVSREVLCSRLWPHDTYVNYDDSLRVAVRKLRDALGDDAATPRYIETVPKRGYRFLGHELQTPLAVPAPLPISEHVAAFVAPAAMAEELGASQPVVARRMPGWAWAACAVLILVVAFAAWRIVPKRKALTATDTIVLADFANLTGDAVFDDALRQGLAVQLEQSTFLKVISGQQVQKTLEMMGKPAGSALTPEIAREICERAGSAAVLDGSIKLLGDRYVLGLRARDCRSGENLSDQQTQVNGKAEVLTRLSTMSRVLREQIGESLALVEQHDTPLPSAATSSLEALKAYSTGIKVLRAQGDAAAVPFFTKATEIDPQFAGAYAQLGLVYGAIGESAQALKNTTRAYELRARATDAERYFISATYELFVTGNMEKAREICLTWASAYPRDPVPHAYLSGAVLPTFGSYDQAGREAEAMIALDPYFSIGYTVGAFSLVSRERYHEAQQMLDKAAGLGLDSFYSSSIRYDLAFLQNDRAETERLLPLSQGANSPDDLLLMHAAFTLAYQGRFAEAKAVSRHAGDLAAQTSRADTAGFYRAGEAVWEAFSGQLNEAKESAAAALTLSNERDVEYGAAFALELAGDSSRAQSLADDLERRFPADTSVRFSYLPELRALAATRKGDATHALDLLRPGAAYDLGMQGSSAHLPFGAMYAVYVRGMVYLALHRPAEAAAEFQKIVGHRGIVINDPVGPAAQLQLARAFSQAGDHLRSKMAYQDLLALWKEGDSETPLLRQARTESSSQNSKEPLAAN